MYYTALMLLGLSMVGVWLAILGAAVVWFVKWVGLYRSIAVAFVAIALLFCVVLVREIRMRHEAQQ